MQHPRYEMTDDHGNFLATVAAPNPNRAVLAYLESEDIDIIDSDGPVVWTDDDGIDRYQLSPLGGDETAIVWSA